MVIPVADRYGQELVKIAKQDGTMFKEYLGACCFVTLKGAYGRSESEGYP
jgi:protein-L-isoaspartate O-methyltransferase